MDLVACHCNGCPLDFEKLLAADEASFGHDIHGIQKYVDRTTGELSPSFLPRCHARQPKKAKSRKKVRR